MKLPHPQLNQTISIAGSAYSCLITGDTYSQKPYKAPCSTQLTRAPNKNYSAILALIPAGQRISNLEEIEHLINLEEGLRKEGKTRREALNDPLFDNLIRGNVCLLEHTNVGFRAPHGYENFEGTRETHPDGRVTYRGDYLIGDKVVAEGIRIPEGRGRKVVVWNVPLRIPAVTSDGSEPQHTTHFHFNPSEREVAVGLAGAWYDDVHGRCFFFDAGYRRSDAYHNGAFCLVQGSLDEVPLPAAENF